MKKTKLVIVGNGFDLSHGFRTRFESFVGSIQDPSLDFFKQWCENTQPGYQINKWFDFEESIKILSRMMFSLKIEHVDDAYDVIKQNIEQRNEAFRVIESLLMRYLAKETSKPFLKKKTMCQLFNDDLYIFNFNYTHTVEK